MIFHHNQLMKNEKELVFYLATNKHPFTCFEDHRAALEIRMHELVEVAFQEQEDPIALIESSLGITYNEGETIEEITHFLINTDHHTHSMSNLQEAWSLIDENLPSESLIHSGTTEEDAVRVFPTITLRSYLESLSKVFDN